MRIFPHLSLFRSLEGWSPGYLGGDLTAGLTLAAIAIPEQMATARLAGFSPQFGFLALVAGSVAFAIFGASRYVSVGADSTIAPIFAGGLSILAAAGSPAYPALAAMLALLVGAVLVLGGLFRLGWIANLLSVPVTTGFLAGIAIHIVVSQLPGVLGLHISGGSDLFASVAAIAANAAHINPYAVGLGLCVFLITFLSEKISGRIPGALIGLLAATLLVVFFHLENRGVPVLGAIAGGMPHLAFPAIAMGDVLRLVALALIVSLVVMVQTAATARAFTPQTGEPPDVNSDFVGVGMGSLLAGMFGAFPVNASPPRTAVAVESGAHSQAAGLLAALIAGSLAIFGRTLLTHIPTAALAGVLFFIALRITRISIFVQTFRQAPVEFGLIVATIIAIVVLPIQIGVAVGIFLSLLHGMWTNTRARVIEFDRVPGTSIWWPPDKTRKGETIERVLVLAFQAPLSFLNADEFRRGVEDAIRRAKRPLRTLILEASSIIEIDFTGAQVLSRVIAHCREHGITFAIARLESVRGLQALKHFGILDLVGEDHLFRSVQEAVDALAPKA